MKNVNFLYILLRLAIQKKKQKKKKKKKKRKTNTPYRTLKGYIKQLTEIKFKIWRFAVLKIFLYPSPLYICDFGDFHTMSCLVLSCYGYPDLIVPHAVKLTVFPRPLAGGQGQYVEIKYVVYLTL